MTNFPRISLTKTGENLSRLMREKGISVKRMQEELSLLSPQAIYKWKRGDCLPSLDNLVAIALLLETTIDRLVVLEE